MSGQSWLPVGNWRYRPSWSEAAATARKLGCLLPTETMDRRPQLKMTSYDRLFPNQDNMPEGGFGNPLKILSPPAAPQRLTSCTSLTHELPLLVVKEKAGRCRHISRAEAWAA